jgi:DNA-binding transcriptional MerR regulator
LGGQLANQGISQSKIQSSNGAVEREAGTQGKRYYRIGEVSRITDVKPYVLRYWESEFRWMAPQKSRSKQRLYRRKDIDMILLIKKMLYEQRFTIAGARKKLRELGAERALGSGNLAIETDHRSRYRKIRSELESIRATL